LFGGAEASPPGERAQAPAARGAIPLIPLLGAEEFQNQRYPRCYDSTKHPAGIGAVVDIL